MGILNKLLGKKEQQEQPVAEETANPDNTNLLHLLDIYSKDGSTDNYRAVIEEIMNGNGYLLLSSNNNGKQAGRAAEPGETLDLNCIFDIEGLQVLAAFTGEDALLAWAKQPMEYIVIPAAAITAFCKQNNIGRVVINSDQHNMFVMERDRSHISTTTIEEPTQVLIGAPAKPLPVAVIDKFKSGFSRIDAVDEAYQFLQHRGEEQSIVIGIRMNNETENTHIAMQNAISDALEGVELEMPIDVMLLSDEGLPSVQNITGSLFYKKGL